ncbi:hypothetical protein N7470_002881 [Penicillium chermesinum]|nr:hypothetical protein N7470_002881 [Penicillium chermesinum]
MSFVKYLLPALAATKVAFASSDCGDTTLETQVDADGIASCSTISGDVTIKDTYSGTLALNGIKKITGSLKANNATGVSSMTADSLTSIGSNFTLNELTGLTQLSFSQLNSVGNIYWEALPELQSLDFPKGISEAGDVSIINTGLTNLNGINLTQVGDFNIEDNKHLESININELKNSTGVINFSGNDDGLNIEFPNLYNAKGLTFRNVSSVMAPSLTVAKSQLGFWGTGLKNFTAMNLTQTGDLTFNDNPNLNNISMPNLQTVNGGFIIKLNEKLDSIDLPKLQTVGGAIQFTGTFNELEFGSLNRVSGAFNVQSTKGNFSCSSFESEFKQKASTAAGSTTGSDDNSGSSGKSSSTSSSAAMANGVYPATGIAAVFFALAQLF